MKPSNHTDLYVVLQPLDCCSHRRASSGSSDQEETLVESGFMFDPHLNFTATKIKHFKQAFIKKHSPETPHSAQTANIHNISCYIHVIFSFKSFTLVIISR